MHAHRRRSNPNHKAQKSGEKAAETCGPGKGRDQICDPLAVLGDVGFFRPGAEKLFRRGAAGG
jgi:hypothetical protein